MNATTLTESRDLVAITLHPVKGRCVVAARPIAKGTRILADPVLVVPVAEAERTEQTILGRYVFLWNDDGDTCAVFGLGSLINHDVEANVELVPNFADRTMDFFALTDIAEGEELVYDYGQDEDELGDYYGIPRTIASANATGGCRRLTSPADATG